MTADGLDGKDSGFPASPDKALFPFKKDFIEEAEPLDVLLCLICFTFTSLEDGSFMQLSIVMPHWLHGVNTVCSLDGELSGIVEACRSVANRQSVVDVALRLVHFLLSGVFGNVAMSLPHWDVQLRTKSKKQFLPHDAHEGGVSHRVTLALFEVVCGDDALVEFLVAILAESNQIIGSIASGLPALSVMHMELDVVLLGRVGAAALTGVAIPPEDVLPDVVLPEHFALLVVFTLQDRLAFLHGLDTLEGASHPLCLLRTRLLNLALIEYLFIIPFLRA